MLTITPELEAVLSRAAELRAAGSCWKATAQSIGYEGDDLELLCKEAGKAYERLYSKPRRNVVREGLAESMFTLRRLLREGDDGEARKAAECLSRISMTFIRHRRRVKANDSKPDPRLEGLRDDDIALVKWMATQTDEQLRDFAERGFKAEGWIKPDDTDTLFGERGGVSPPVIPSVPAG